MSWAGGCPGNNESAGKRFSGRVRKGNRYLRRVLTQSAWSITHKKECFLTSLFWRVAARGGRTKAAIAVAHRVLAIAWHIIKNEGEVYREVGGSHQDRLRPQRSARRLVHRLEQLGFEVNLKAKAREAAPAPESVTLPPSPVNRRSHRSLSSTPASHQKPEAVPADPSICRRCARWGIACIHLRNANRRPSVVVSPDESIT